MRKRAQLLALCALCALGCEFTIPSGRFACDETADCPPAQRCSAGLCVAEGSDGGGMDAAATDAAPGRDGGDSLDAAGDDAGATLDDAGPFDAGSLDAGPFDAGSSDAGSLDAGPFDAGRPDAGPPDAGPRTCNPVANDCGANDFCDAPNCGTAGVCRPRPTSTSNVHRPACGCDGTSYWNAAHANWLGATAFETGTHVGCGTASQNCMSASDCTGAGAVCVIDFGLMACGSSVLGQCWGIPSGATCSGSVSLPDIVFGRCGISASCSSGLDLCEARLARNFYVACL